MTVWWGPSIIAFGIAFCRWQFSGPESIMVVLVAAGLNACFGSLGDAINKKCDCGRKNRIQEFMTK